MPLIRYHPVEPLAQYVECLWWSHRLAAQEHWEHILPSGRLQLVFALHERPILCLPASSTRPMTWSGSLVHGPQSGYYLAGPKPTGAVAGVSFRPGAAGAVLGIPAGALTDRHVGLEEIWGRGAQDLQEQLLGAADTAAVFHVLEQSLIGRIRAPLFMHPVVAQALALGAPWASGWTSQVQQASGFSPRHFIALFRNSVGLPPKHYQRIQRFNRITRHVASTAGSRLADVAIRGGYSDQAHFSREFRALAGIPPTAYRPIPGAPLHHGST